MTVSDQEFLNAICRENLSVFTQKAMSVLEPGTPYMHNWHVDAIAEHLKAVWDGEIKNLVINMPPRTLKTHCTAIAFPAWGFGKNPSIKFMLTSFKSGLAEKMTRKCRMLLKSQWYAQCFPGAKISEELDRQYYFETTERGQYFSSAMSNVTGEGCDIQICFPAGTMITTSDGNRDIKDIVNDKNSTLVLSFNHVSGSVEWKPVIGKSIVESEEFVQVCTESGFMFKCTPNHKVWVHGIGYVKAKDIKEGQVLVKENTRKVGGFNLCSVWEGLQENWLRVRKSKKERTDRFLLFKSMFKTPPCGKECQGMRDLWHSNACRSRSSILLEGLQAKCQEVGTEDMPRMLQDIPTEIITVDVLQPEVCRHQTLSKNDRGWKFKIQGWHVLCKEVQRYTTSYLKAGQLSLRSLLQRTSNSPDKTPNKQDQNESSHSSYRRENAQQLTRKPSNDVWGMSYDSSQVSFDKVSLVKRLREESQPVYDLTVQDNHNLFANGILCHNCDDPQAPDEALSDTVRATTIETIRGTLFSRFNDPRTGRFVLNQQRLHDGDATGELLKDMGWVHLKLPAEAKGRSHIIKLKDKTWEMKENDLLFPARFTREVLDSARERLGEYNYAGQYLQEPVPIGGGEFRQEWKQVYHQGAIKPTEMNVCILVDPSGGEETNKKKRKLSDYTAMIVVGLGTDNNYYVLDMVRDRLNPTERVNTLFVLHRKWNALCGKPPKVGYEKYGMMTDTHYIEDKKRQDAYHFSLIELGGGMAKEERIRRLIPDMQNSRWYFPGNLIYVDGEGRRFDLVHELWHSEIPTFPRSRYDDLLDALSRIYESDLSMVFPKPKLGMVANARRAASSETQSWETF